MVFSKALFLKGLAGVATVGTVALGWGFKEQIFGKKEIKEDDLGIPTSCTQTCELTKEQFEKIKFQEKSGSTVTFEGLSESDKITLTIEDKTSDTTNYPKGKSYKFKTASDQKTVTIKGSGDSDISITNTGTGVDFRETTGGGKLEKVPVVQSQTPATEGVNNLGIPNDCSTTCELTKEQLKKIKFEAKDGSSTISIDGLDENDKVILTIEDKSSDTTNYPKGKKYNFKTKTSGKTATIKNAKDGDISINEKGIDFKEKVGDVLEKVTETQKQTASTNAMGIPADCSTSCELTSEQLKALKFEPKSNSTIEIEGLSGEEKVTLKIADSSDSTNYPKGKKYTLTSTKGGVKIKNTKDGDISLTKDKGIDFRETTEGSKLETIEDALGIPKGCTASKPCDLTKDQFEKIKFEPKSDSSITIEGLSEGDTVTLTIEDKSTDTTNYPKGKKYNFKTKTSGKTVTIKNAKDQDISISDAGVNFKETSAGGKLEKDNTSS